MGMGQTGHPAELGQQFLPGESPKIDVHLIRPAGRQAPMDPGQGEGQMGLEQGPGVVADALEPLFSQVRFPTSHLHALLTLQPFQPKLVGLVLDQVDYRTLAVPESLADPGLELGLG